MSDYGFMVYPSNIGEIDPLEWDIMVEEIRAIVREGQEQGILFGPNGRGTPDYGYETGLIRFNGNKEEGLAYDSFQFPVGRAKLAELRDGSDYVTDPDGYPYGEYVAAVLSIAVHHAGKNGPGTRVILLHDDEDLNSCESFEEGKMLAERVTHHPVACPYCSQY